MQNTQQSHYVLKQLCKLYSQVLSLQHISECKSESESSMLSNSSDDDDDSDDDDESGDGSKASKPAADTVSTVVAKYIISNCYKRQIFMKQSQPLSVTASVIVSMDG